MLRQQETCVSGRSDDLRVRLTPEQLAQMTADALAWGEPPPLQPFSQPRVLRVLHPRVSTNGSAHAREGGELHF